MKITRRTFLKAAVTGAGALVAKDTLALTFLKPIDVENPLGVYPNRGWERIYPVPL